MLKFNYLLRALRGDAKEAIDFKSPKKTMKRYDNNEQIIDQLYRRLEQVEADSLSTYHQRKLLDQIAMIIAQLETKQEDVNHRQLLTQISRKFSTEIQLKVLERKAEHGGPRAWNWTCLYAELDGIISKKRYIEETQELAMRGRASKFTMNTETYPTKPHRNTQRKPECLYCEQITHSYTSCQAIPLQERFAHFIRHQLCTNCEHSDHRVRDCNKRGCRICGLKHHTSLHDSNPPFQQIHTDVQSSQQPRPLPTTPKADSNRRRVAPQNFVSRQKNGAEVQPVEDRQATMQINEQSAPKAQLLTGTTEIIGPHGTKTVRILLDTGSELSFIQSHIVEKLQLPCVGQQSLHLSTFGSVEAKEQIYDIILVKLKDEQGKVMEFTMHKTDVITNCILPNRHTEEDLKFIKQNGIKLADTSIHLSDPEILLGCDQLWTVMKPQIFKMPSGLHLISTSFGHMISGRESDRPHNNNKILMTCKRRPSNKRRRRKQWKDFFAFESSGTHEYKGPQHQEKQHINEQVLKRFNETIVKKPDGYYVQLPWKEDHEHLPDNKGIAEARLRSIYKAYHNNPRFLQEYDEIFKDQLAKGILEEAHEYANTNARRIHYLSHHAVVTPEKKTTPKRIVFDASAHYRNKPCLNDMLHQGPVILPKILGMLLRFRTGKIAMSSDVEKAFLQVRLQEQDRDVTRCLWLKDITKPPVGNNIVTYRFTRVTFGINCSPFLLAATIRFHLSSVEQPQSLVKEINDNLYVDNLFFAAESSIEAISKYKATKTIFGELNMNLREFMSNDASVNAQLSSKDISSEENPKVLGIRWKSAMDVLVLDNHKFDATKPTRRTILKALASVYDPMGWLTPLMLKTKLFFQYLWTKAYDWDSELTKEDAQIWNKILIETKGFPKEVPRRIADKGAKYHDPSKSKYHDPRTRVPPCRGVRA
ncbi:unnamed protein product [Nippostrongylus brasiliensis]|uniref:DUF1758 domain-containing protein n=1 Tax=Nippostrongylus brasiliensis TaxID=27835 RepID=A0A0N4YUL3_NIPBR|nr:unnamed protein product [Nippostrongylus brasiliensis]